MGTDNVVFLEVLEWLDPTGGELAHRLPQKGSGELKLGAQAIVRESQAAVFFSGGVACDALGPGRHTLTTANIPILTKLLAIPWGLKSPFRAEVYFVNLKVFNGLKWGTRDPVAFRDSELGLVRLRAHGVLNVQVVQPVLFVNTLVGTQPSFGIGALEEYLADVVVSRLNDHLGENLDTLLNLPSRYEDLAAGLTERLTADLAAFGLALRGVFINAITPPAEVQQAIDERSRLGAIGGNLQELLQLKMAMALEKGGEGRGVADGGLALGLGMMVPGFLSGLVQGGAPAAGGSCSECGLALGREDRFCPHCGAQILVQRRCACGQDLPPRARFCPACGLAAGAEAPRRRCAGCGTENRPEAVFCNGCGGRLPGG